MVCALLKEKMLKYFLYLSWLIERGTEKNQEEYLENASLSEFEIFDMLLSRERKSRHDLKSDFQEISHKENCW